jgi:acetyltransferase-like isoleucine patch superfamily enzyme
LNAIVSPDCRIRYPEHFVVGDHSIVDDYCYFSTKVRVGVRSHIAASCTIAGGPSYTFSLGDFSSLASGVRVYCSSNDYVNGLVMIAPDGLDEPLEEIAGDVTIGNYTGIGANTVIMPGNAIPEGTVIGAMSFVPSTFWFEPWAVYVGSPIRLVKNRNKAKVLAEVERVRRALGVR